MFTSNRDLWARGVGEAIDALPQGVRAVVLSQTPSQGAKRNVPLCLAEHVAATRACELSSEDCLELGAALLRDGKLVEARDAYERACQHSDPDRRRDACMLLVAGFMLGYGVHLCVVTWGNTIAEFPSLSTGVVYMPIPIGGLLTLLFIGDF